MTVDPLAEAAVRRQQQIEEYSQYVARDTIVINGAPAFGPGDPVPTSHVERGVVSEDDVIRREELEASKESSTVETVDETPKAEDESSQSPVSKSKKSPAKSSDGE